MNTNTPNRAGAVSVISFHSTVHRFSLDVVGYVTSSEMTTGSYLAEARKGNSTNRETDSSNLEPHSTNGERMPNHGH
jgi:hypothetical protein